MKAGTFFSGIDAPEVSAPQFDWRWRAEIDPFANAVSGFHRPGVPNLGDMEKADFDHAEPVELVVFGSPCQSFSVAGKRLGLDDPRGNLALVALAAIGRIRPRWFVFENVPGLLSSDGGRDFGAFLGAVGQLGYGWAYRTLDAQHFGVPQRRRRVFVVGCLGDWRGPAAVLFERESLHGHFTPSREAGQGTAPTLSARTKGGGGLGTDFDCDGGLTAGPLQSGHTPKGHGMAGINSQAAHSGHIVPAIAFSAKDHGADAGETAPTLRAGGHLNSHANAGVMPAVCIDRTTETMYGVSHADAQKTGPDQALRALREAVGAATFSQWGIRIVLALWAQEILRSEVHGRGVRYASDVRHKLDDDALSRAQDRPTWTVHALWEAGCIGCPPQGWQPSERLAQELGAYLSELSHQRTQAARFLLSLWRASEGLGLLRQTLSALQEIWRSANDECQSAPSSHAVRRLTPREAERLQGFPDDYTRVPYRNKPASQCPDGPRYKALGNSMAVPCIGWVLARVEAVHGLLRAAA